MLGELELHVKIGDLKVRSTFLVADNLAVDVLLETEFIIQHKMAILPN